jgi:hypothetical protein
MTPDALRGLATLGEGLIDPTLLRATADTLEQPVRLVLAGRVGAGKTTWFNHLTGSSSPAGLGGVTLDTSISTYLDAELVDTPGIDDPDAAIVKLGPVLDGADRVLWVVDGLQPLTASERRVAEALVDTATERVVVVSRGDLLEPADAAAVADRVRTLWGVEPFVTDLRHQPPPAPSTLGGPRRRHLARTALDDLRHQLAARGPDPTLASLRLRLRDRVRSVVAGLRDRVASGDLPDKGAAVAALRRAASTVHDELLAGLPHPVPDLPLPNEPAQGVLDQLRQRVSGQEGARRVLEAEAGRWLVEAQLALGDWFDDQPELAEVGERRATLEAALAEADPG